MKTTLREIFKHDPCGQDSKSEGWGLLLKNLNKTKADDEPLSLIEILESNGVEDAVWALGCFEYRDCCLFLADVAESVLYIFEKKFPSDNRPRNCIQGIRDFHAGNITEEELKGLRVAAYEAYIAGFYTGGPSFSDATDAAFVACKASDSHFYSIFDAALAAATGSGDVVATSIAAEAKRRKQQEIEQLFIKHFRDK